MYCSVSQILPFVARSGIINADSAISIGMSGVGEVGIINYKLSIGEVGKWGSGEVGKWGSGEIELKPQNPITPKPYHPISCLLTVSKYFSTSAKSEFESRDFGRD